MAVEEEGKGGLVLEKELLSESSSNWRPCLDKELVGGLEAIDATFDLFDTPVFSDAPVVLMS